MSLKTKVIITITITIMTTMMTGSSRRTRMDLFLTMCKMHSRHKTGNRGWKPSERYLDVRYTDAQESSCYYMCLKKCWNSNL